MFMNTHPHRQGIGCVSRIQHRYGLLARLNRFAVSSPGGLVVRYRPYHLLPIRQQEQIFSSQLLYCRLYYLLIVAHKLKLYILSKFIFIRQGYTTILKLLFTCQVLKMLDKLTKPLQALTQLTTSHSRQDTATTFGQSTMIQHTCPCCCDTLLGHMRLGGLYWRCCSCRQEMPVQKPALERSQAILISTAAWRHLRVGKTNRATLCVVLQPELDPNQHCYPDFQE